MMPTSKENGRSAPSLTDMCADANEETWKTVQNSFNFDGSPKYGNEREVNDKERMQF